MVSKEGRRDRAALSIRVGQATATCFPLCWWRVTSACAFHTATESTLGPHISLNEHPLKSFDNEMKHHYLQCFFILP